MPALEGPYAPGLKRMKRHNGRVDLYWVAAEEAVKSGFRPKTQRLIGDWDNPADQAEIANRCRILTAEQREWLAGKANARNPAPPGTVEWLCIGFETEPESPFHGTRPATQKFYSRYIRTIVADVGPTQIRAITGQHVRRWHKQWLRQGERGAKACVQTLRRVVSYGAGDLADDACLRLAQILENVTFSVPAGRKVRATYDQVRAVRDVAHEAGRHSIGLAITLQFELGLRQKDVIGEWTGKGPGVEGWEWGLTWSHIDGDLVLRKPTSKSNGNEVATHDLKCYPDLIAEIARIPAERRVGPVVIEERSGKPWTPSHFSRQFRKLARVAGWPDDVWNMDSRAGAVSEAFEAGAQAEDVMRAATHTQLSTTMGYNRGAVIQSSRVAEMRQRKRAENTNR